MPDGDFVGLDRLDASRAAPRLIVLHGLEGSSRSHYVRGLLRGAEDLGWGADVLVFRGCGGLPNEARRFYHSGETGDLEAVASRLREEHPDSPLVVAGFSLGGNVLLKWLGERGTRAPVHAAVAISVPFDLELGARHIHRGFSRIYERNFLASLRRKALGKRTRFADLPAAARIRAARTIFDFDDCVTAPVHGFRDASDYYTQSSAQHFLPHIRVPTLLLSARDDPFLPASVLDRVLAMASANPALTTEFVEYGGHAGFVEGAFPWKARYYAERRTLQFLAHHLPAFPRDRPTDSFLRPSTEESSHA